MYEDEMMGSSTMPAYYNMLAGMPPGPMRGRGMMRNMMAPLAGGFGKPGGLMGGAPFGLPPAGGPFGMRGLPPGMPGPMKNFFGAPQNYKAAVPGFPGLPEAQIIGADWGGGWQPGPGPGPMGLPPAGMGIDPGISDPMDQGLHPGFGPQRRRLPGAYNAVRIFGNQKG